MSASLRLFPCLTDGICLLVPHTASTVFFSLLRPNVSKSELTCVCLPLVQAWEGLEKAEHERELALRTELIRQEKLEQLSRRFDRKAAMRETWLSENQRLVSQVQGAGVHMMFDD